MEHKMKALIAVGASVAANCQPCLNYHVRKAKEAGADEHEIAMAIEVAKAVRKGAAAKMDEFAAGISAAAKTEECGAGQGCSCTA
jgi:AhpD family alkylhydroperoxidase